MASAGLTASAGLVASVGVMAPPGVIVVDEAHAFINPASRRAQALGALAARAPVLLLSATPIGMSPEELCKLLRLFLPVGALAPVLGESLEEHLAPCGSSLPAGPAADLGALLRTVLIRHPRALIQRRWPEGVEVRGRGGERALLCFPERDLLRLGWSVEPPAALDALIEGMESLDEGALGLPGGLLRALLLARLESSPAALSASLARLEGFLTRSKEAILAGGSLDRAAWRRLFDGLAVEEDRQLVMPFMFEAISGGGGDSNLIDAQLWRVRRLRAQADALRAVDSKLLMLLDFVRSTVEGSRVLVFARFRDTARAVYEGLIGGLPRVGVGLVCGAGGWVGGQGRASGSGRRAVEGVLASFAAERGGVRVLVATDVLAEGHDMRGCGCVVSYDLAWNPRVLVQRHGRIDRLGPGRRRARVVVMAPEGALEERLRLVERLGQRAAVMEVSMGQVGVLARVGGDPGGGAAEVACGIEERAAVELDMRSDRLALEGLGAGRGSRGVVGGEVAPGWALWATPRHPPGCLFVMDLGVAGALLYWCFVPEGGEGGVEVDRGVLYDRLRRLMRSEARARVRAPSRALRCALASALGERARLRSASMRPWVHPPGSASALLMRRLCEEAPPGLGEVEALRRRGAAFEALRRPLPAHVGGWLAGALDAGEPLCDVIDGLLSRVVVEGVGGSEGCGEVRVVGFLVFEVRSPGGYGGG